MKALCTCQKVLLVLGVREMDLNEQVWSQIRSKSVSWADMQSALEQLTAKRLITKAERKVEGHRLANFYTLTSAGQTQKSLLLSGEKENGAESIFKGSCCLNKAA
ncbi:MAG: hypothetical protein Q8Q95_00820 [bacterium]|nr:hypothetical protein [bacterium]